MNQEVINQVEWQKPENWAGPKWAPLYFSKSDSRIIVPKHLRRGWTLNLGKNKSVGWLVAIVATLSLATLFASMIALRSAYGLHYRFFSLSPPPQGERPVPLNFLGDMPGLSEINSSITESEFREILARQPLKAHLNWDPSDSSVTYFVQDKPGHRATFTFQEGTCTSIRRLPDISKGD